MKHALKIPDESLALLWMVGSSVMTLTRRQVVALLNISKVELANSSGEQIRNNELQLIWFQLISNPLVYYFLPAMCLSEYSKSAIRKHQCR